MTAMKWIKERHGKTKPAIWTTVRGAKKAQPKLRKRVRPISSARAKQLAEYAKLKRQWLKGKSCQAPLVWKHPNGKHLISTSVTKCGNPKVDLHHSRGRVKALLCLTEFWIPLCRKCHDWVRDNPKDARWLGLLCKEGDWNKVPIILIALIMLSGCAHPSYREADEVNRSRASLDWQNRKGPLYYEQLSKP